MNTYVETCVQMGLKQCSECFFRNKYGGGCGSCWVDFYENLISIPYVKSVVLGKKRYGHFSVPQQHIYFLAALRRKPEALAVFEKLMLLT
jgi:hypothetical protein